MLATNSGSTAALARPARTPLADFGFAPGSFSGQVYGALLNPTQALADLGEAVFSPPYKAPPRAPALYFKPIHTHLAPGQAPRIAIGVNGVNGANSANSAEGMSLGASLGIVIGRPCRRVSAQDALAYVAGFAAVADLFVPHQDFYRPSVRLRARDATLAVGRPSPAAQIANPDALGLRVSIAGQTVCESSTNGMQRSVADLLADVSEFMTLQPGDLLLLGTLARPPLLRVGQTARIEIDGLAPLDLAPALAEEQV